MKYDLETHTDDKGRKNLFFTGSVLDEKAQEDDNSLV